CLGEIETVALQHFATDRRCSAITADDDIDRSGSLLARYPILQMKNFALHIHSNTALLEMDFSTPFLGSVHERNVEFSTRNRIDEFCPAPAIRLKCSLRGRGMHHPAFHRTNDSLHIVPQASLRQSVNASRR